MGHERRRRCRLRAPHVVVTSGTGFRSPCQRTEEVHQRERTQSSRWTCPGRATPKPAHRCRSAAGPGGHLEFAVHEPDHGLTVWTLDTGHHNFDPVERDTLLTKEVVPRVSSLPGFVEGRWNRSPDGVRADNTVVFDDQAAAEGFVGYVRVICRRRPPRGSICTP